MPFKKLNAPLKEAIERVGFEAPTEFQKKVLSRIKGGANLFGIGPKKSGKTTALIISTIQKLKSMAEGDNPRALIFVKDKAAALVLAEAFEAFTKETDLRVYTAYEEQDYKEQKDAIYLGVDIVIATPKRLSKLYFLNGINFTQLQVLIVEDGEFLMRNSFHTDVDRITESLTKCQYLIFAEKFISQLEKLDEKFMENAQVVELK